MSKQNTTSTRARRIAAALGAMAITVAGLGAATASAAPPANGAQDPGLVLPERMRGEAAIQAMGARLPDVAGANRMSVDELRRALRTDDQLWVDPTGALLFVDEMLAIDDHGHTHDDEHGHEADVPAGDGAAPAFGEIPPSDAFSLHSRPGAQRVIHLDLPGRSPQRGRLDALERRADHRLLQHRHHRRRFDRRQGRRQGEDHERGRIGDAALSAGQAA